MTPLFKKTAENDGFHTLERKMVRTLALHRELQKLLEAEHEAGSNFETRTLTKLTLRKNNCINRLENLVGSIRDQLIRMAEKELPRTCPRTLANRLRTIPGLTPDREEVLLPLARELEEENRALIEATRKNIIMFKGAMNRIWAVSRYANQGGGE
ncbi:flagellar protein FlgN [Desulfospira joergensenii]|uniref:flagellar protein FlgN n=1 Tax=Desulfospira joergensenii TaxID=53329 RepID=UPI0003B5E0ED|nr:flagellar protein FlgN [Desulfospira joergensenii]